MATTATELPYDSNFADNTSSEDSFHSAMEPEPHPKLLLIAKNVQNKKTFQTIAFMKQKFQEDQAKGNSLHIVFAMNSTNNQAQFNLRILGDLGKDFKGKVAIVSSDFRKIPKEFKPLSDDEAATLDEDELAKWSLLSERTRLIKSLNELRDEELFSSEDVETEDDAIRVIVVCTNPYRTQHVQKLIKFINQMKESARYHHRVFLYFDDYHKYFSNVGKKGLSPQDLVNKISHCEIVLDVIAISKNKLIKLYEKNS